MKRLSDDEKAKLQAEIEQARTERIQLKSQKGCNKNLISKRTIIGIGLFLLVILGDFVVIYVFYKKGEWQGIIVKKDFELDDPYHFVIVEHKGNRYKKIIPESIWDSVNVGDRVIKKKDSFELMRLQSDGSYKIIPGSKSRW